jgi:hypothetical protein
MSDEVLALLRSLPPDLPDPVDRVGEVKARVLAVRRRRAVGATVLAVLAFAVPPSVLLGGGSAPVSTPLACPQVHTGAPPWVPDLPRGVDGRSRLVPPQAPVRAVVCAYAGMNTDPEQAGWALTSGQELTAGLDGLADDLTLAARRTAPVACPAVGGPQVNYLLGLTYQTGTLWLSTADDPGQCSLASNGLFTANGIGKAVATAYDAGRWTGIPPDDTVPCGGGVQLGRLGQDAALVPSGAVSAEICRGNGPSVRLTSGFNGLVDALNQLPTEPAGYQCHTDGNVVGYQLLFRYAMGPPVLIRIFAGCRPAIMNGSLGANDASTALPIVEQLLEAR